MADARWQVRRLSPPDGCPRAALLTIEEGLEITDLSAVRGHLHHVVPPAEVLICDVGRMWRPHIGTVDALARLRLCLQRRGCLMVLRGAGEELRALIGLAGLTEELTPTGQVSRRDGMGRPS